ncbi:hypothetical protein [Brevundimonas sp.]|uniref:hypothetical protein n=1 Tax=Brevundimonas sp. TaxID=1871086 RepID=UPI00391BF720
MTAASPFAQARAELSPLGFTLLPALPHNLDRPGAGKAPGHFVSGGWSGLSGWSKFLQTAPSSFQQSIWERMEGANVGFLAGTPAGFDAEGNPTKLVALDFDCRDPDAIHQAAAVLQLQALGCGLRNGQAGELGYA